VSTEKRDDALERAIEAAGGVTALCQFINEKSAEKDRLTTQAISQWRRCPDRRVLIVERAAAEGAKARDIETPPTRHDLRPDLYPLEAAA
jgi:hypothetical protein